MPPRDPIFYFILGSILFLWCAAAFAVDPVVVVEAEKDGLAIVYTIVLAVATGIGGWFVKRPQDMKKDREEEQSYGGKGSHDLAKIAYEAIKAHEAACEEYRREQREASRKTHERINSIGDRLSSIESTLARLDERSKMEYDLRVRQENG